jgi:hypothetical protein
MDGNGKGGVELHEVVTLTIAYDRETCLVSVNAQGLPISLAQMMVFEAMEQLQQMRRLAAAQQMKAQLEQQAENARIAAAVRGR